MRAEEESGVHRIGENRLIHWSAPMHETQFTLHCSNLSIPPNVNVCQMRCKPQTRASKELDRSGQADSRSCWVHPVCDFASFVGNFSNVLNYLDR